MADRTAKQQSVLFTGTPEQLIKELDRRLRNLEGDHADLKASLQDVRHTAPPKPREGMFAFADGTDWDPGSGRGLYQYVNTSWVKL